MANEPGFDPGAQFREFVTQWERGFDKLANQLMGTDAYASWMNQVQQSQLAAQKTFTDFVSTQLTNLNLPSREDVIRLAETVRTMDARLERVEQMLAQMTQSSHGTTKPGGKKPARTRKPPPVAAQGEDQQGGRDEQNG